jgi:hypothetical protein
VKRPAERFDLRDRLGGHCGGAPAYALEQRRIEPPQPEQDVPSVLRGVYDGVIGPERVGGGAQPSAVQIGAVGSDEQHRLRGRGHPGEPFAEPAFSLCGKGQPRLKLVPLPRIGVAAQLHCQPRRQRLVHAPLQHLPRQLGGALRAERGDQPGLDLSRHRFLGEDDDSGHPRRQR